MRNPNGATPDMYSCCTARSAVRAHSRALLIALVFFSLASCSRHLSPIEHLAVETPETGVKVLLVGIDGATLRVIDALAAQGELPEFERLMREGVRGVIRSQSPTRSPALWTTIATGHKRSEHGITDFTVPISDGEGGKHVLVSSRQRRKLALWNLMAPLGKTTGFLGWWATWPAEPVDGWLVSDRMTRTRWSEWTGGARDRALTYPPALAAEMQKLVVDPMSPPMDEIEALVELSPDERRELEAVQKPIFGHWLSVFKFAYCSQRSYERMALHLLDRGQPDLTGIFLIANDPISHTFWHFYEPQKFRGVDPAQAKRLGRLIPDFYIHNDSFLGQLRRLVDPDTVILVVSDHGFQASGRLPEHKPREEFAKEFGAAEVNGEEGAVAVGQSGRHGLAGILLGAGGPLRQGVEVRARLYDVAPTILALLGLPVPEDLPGRVLEEILQPDFLQRYPIRRIASYEGLIPLPARALDLDGEDEEALEMLRSLGYIQ